MKKVTINLIQYDNCNDCPYLEIPNEKGEIPFPGGKLVLSKTVYSKTAKSFIENPIRGRCGVSGKRLTMLNGCRRWFNGTNVINYE